MVGEVSRATRAHRVVRAVIADPFDTISPTMGTPGGTDTSRHITLCMVMDCVVSIASSLFRF